MGHTQQSGHPDTIRVSEGDREHPLLPAQPGLPAASVLLTPQEARTSHGPSVSCSPAPVLSFGGPDTGLLLFFLRSRAWHTAWQMAGAPLVLVHHPSCFCPSSFFFRALPPSSPALPFSVPQRWRREDFCFGQETRCLAFCGLGSDAMKVWRSGISPRAGTTLGREGSGGRGTEAVGATGICSLNGNDAIFSRSRAKGDPLHAAHALQLHSHVWCSDRGSVPGKGQGCSFP